MLPITRSRWNSWASAERRRAAEELVARLPAGATFTGLRTHALGGLSNEVAEFGIGGAAFCLVPGGRATIGFDPGDWEPTPEELESWEGTAEEYELDPSPQLHLRKVLLAPREIDVPTLLVEAQAEEVGWTPVDPADPEVQEALKDLKGSTVEVHRGGSVLRVERDEHGRITVQRPADLTFDGVVQTLADRGFRLPTSDEWEYLAGGGARTLFRWGDHVPCDRYPTDVSPEEAAWRREWVISGGTLKPPAEGFASDWGFHRAPNAFGLQIAVNPYYWELTGDEGVSRGGDGGCAICGGDGFFAGWLPLATAWYEQDFCHPAELIQPGFTVLRRVIEVA